MLVERVDTEDENTFKVLHNGQPTVFEARREVLIDGKRGHWILYRDTSAGELEADRDQYSNDILERIGISFDRNRNIRDDVPAYYSHKFKKVCTKKMYATEAFDIINELQAEFGGEWTSDYYDWEGKAVYTRVFTFD